MNLPKVDACYPYLGIEVPKVPQDVRGLRSYGAVSEPGVYGSTMTDPDLFKSLLSGADSAC